METQVNWLHTHLAHFFDQNFWTYFLIGVAAAIMVKLFTRNPR